MIGLLIVTHGNFGLELLRSAELIVGKQNQVIALGLMSGSSVDEYSIKIMESIKTLDSGNGVLVLADLFGGSPCNVTAMNMKKITEQGKVECITGVNLPIMIEALSIRSGYELQRVKEQCIEAGRNGIRDLLKELNSDI